MKIWKLNGALALILTTLAGGLMAQLTQAPATQAPTIQPPIAPPLFKSYQAGLNEAVWTNKPLFVIFRCER